MVNDAYCRTCVFLESVGFCKYMLQESVNNLFDGAVVGIECSAIAHDVVSTSENGCHTGEDLECTVAAHRENRTVRGYSVSLQVILC